MPARFRVALQGFSEFERSTLALCFRLAPTRIPAYDEVSEFAECDFIVADCDMAGVVASVTRAGRLEDTVFVGPAPVAGALGHVRRPIDPTLLVRELDALAALRSTRKVVNAPPASVDVAKAAIAAQAMAASERAEQAKPAAAAPPAPAASPPAPAVAPAPAPAVASAPERAAAPAPAPAPARMPPPAAAPTPPQAETPVPRVMGAAAEPMPAPADALTPHDVKARARAKARATAARRRSDAQTSDPSDVTGEVLVLDDSDIAGQYLANMLEELGLHVHLARTSTEALELLTHRPIAIAFLDIVLGEGDELDGLDICQRIKHEPLALGGGAPIVVLISGQAPASDRVRATLAGSDAFLTKPFGQKDLVRALESCGLTLLPTLTLPVVDRPRA